MSGLWNWDSFTGWVVKVATAIAGKIAGVFVWVFSDIRNFGGGLGRGVN
jgi:hypothetical protein